MSLRMRTVYVQLLCSVHSLLLVTQALAGGDETCSNEEVVS